MAYFDKTLSAFGKNVFSTREFTALLGKSAGYARLALHRLKARKKIVNVKRGWWAEPNALPEEAATAISFPCYVSFHSALYLHGATTQIPSLVQLAVARKARKYLVFGNAAREYRVPAAAFSGFDSRKDFPLASPEKAFADCLRLPRACPEIVLVEALSALDERKIRGYCARSRRMLERLEKIKKRK
jgi:predicted transcriptional regulator of viral defense system